MTSRSHDGVLGGAFPCLIGAHDQVYVGASLPNNKSPYLFKT